MANAARNLAPSYRVLLVDDEPILLRLTARILTMYGHEVRSTGSPTEAIAWFEADPDAVDLLITDHSMPQLTGPELLLHLHAIRPDLPCIIVSGHDTDNDRQGRIMRLAKPFTPSTLKWAVEQMSDG